MTILKYLGDNKIRIYSFKEKDSSIEGNLLFKYDKIFKSDKTQSTIYEKVGKRIVGNVKKKYNGTNFVWSNWLRENLFEFYKGITPRIVEKIFTSIKGL